MGERYLKQTGDPLGEVRDAVLAMPGNTVGAGCDSGDGQGADLDVVVSEHYREEGDPLAHGVMHLDRVDAAPVEVDPQIAVLVVPDQLHGRDLGCQLLAQFSHAMFGATGMQVSELAETDGPDTTRRQVPGQSHR